MSEALKDLIALLSLDSAGENIWRGLGSKNDGAEGTYGGHFLGQATAAAQLSVAPDRYIHSLHGYFLRGGVPGEPYDYHVENVRDGRTFSHRRVTAMQNGKAMFDLLAAFMAAEDGRRIKSEPPEDFGDLPEPESLPRYHEMMANLDEQPLPEEWALREHGVDIRNINAPWNEQGPSARGGIRHWIRSNGTAPNNRALHAAMLAYQSDESVSDNILIPFGLTWGTPGITFVSLDHAMWFHREVDLNEWHFVEQWPEAGGHGRGLAHGKVWSRSGELIASFSQEALMRLD
ncbi:MAG: acyl-CoA thioesterase domain-containing protein [Pseudomonadota bacterium]